MFIYKCFTVCDPLMVIFFLSRPDTTRYTFTVSLTLFVAALLVGLKGSFSFTRGGSDLIDTAMDARSRRYHSDLASIVFQSKSLSPRVNGNASLPFSCRLRACFHCAHGRKPISFCDWFQAFFSVKYKIYMCNNQFTPHVTWEYMIVALDRIREHVFGGLSAVHLLWAAFCSGQYWVCSRLRTIAAPRMGWSHELFNYVSTSHITLNNE